MEVRWFDESKHSNGARLSTDAALIRALDEKKIKGKLIGDA